MFVDLVFKFCCSSRQKPEEQQNSKQGSYIQAPEPQRLPSTQGFEEMLSSQRQKVGSGQKIQTEEFPKKQLSTSIENNLSDPIEQFVIQGPVQPNVSSAGNILDPPVQQIQINLFVEPYQGMNEELSQPHQIQFQVTNLARTTIASNAPRPVIKRCASTQTFEQPHEPQKIQNKKIKKEQNSIATQQRRVKIWEPQEDNLLRKLYYETNGNWQEIAKQIPGRNMNQCSQRWRRLNPQQPAKQKWSYEDDKRIVELVQKHGRNWMEISRQFNGRTGKQIRERYLNKLDPNLRHDPWTKEEDDFILETFKNEGPKWSAMSSNLKGRSENMVKNRFYSHIRKQATGEMNKYQIVWNDLKQENSDINSSLEMKPTPYSENGSYSSSGVTNLSYYDSLEGFEEEINFNFEDQCRLESNGNYSSNNYPY